MLDDLLTAEGLVSLGDFGSAVDLGAAGDLLAAEPVLLLVSLGFFAGASLPAMAAMLGKLQPNHWFRRGWRKKYKTTATSRPMIHLAVGP